MPPDAARLAKRQGRRIRGGISVALVLPLAALLCGGGPATAAVITDDAAPSAAVTDRLVRMPAPVAADSLATAPGALSRPAFDPAAGASGTLGIQPTLAPPQTLSGSDAIMPTVRETLSASVTAVDLFADASVGPGLVLPPRAGTVFAASGTTAVIGPRNGLGDAGRRRGTDRFGGGAALATAGRLQALVPSSVFIDRRDEPAAARPAQAPMVDLATLQGGGVLTVYQALRDSMQAPAADQTIEGFAIAAPSGAASGLTSGAARMAWLRLPMKITSSGYGYLSSSLTVFGDDSGSFSGIGQSFNGLTALDVAEPASLAIVAAILPGLAMLRRRLRHRPASPRADTAA